MAIKNFHKLVQKEPERIDPPVEAAAPYVASAVVPAEAPPVVPAVASDPEPDQLAGRSPWLESVAVAEKRHALAVLIDKDFKRLGEHARELLAMTSTLYGVLPDKPDFIGALLTGSSVLVRLETELTRQGLHGEMRARSVYSAKPFLEDFAGALALIRQRAETALAPKEATDG